MAAQAFFTGEQYQNQHPSGQNTGRTFYILMLRTTAGGKVMLYIPYGGHRHFSETNQMATLFNAVQSCAPLLVDLDREVDGNVYRGGWQKEYVSNGVKFICQASLEIGQCIKLFHSESQQAYKAHNHQRMQDRFNEKPRYGNQF